MNTTSLTAMLTRSHLETLAVTGGQQPWGSLQQSFKDEQIFDWLDPVFLDRPAFVPCGHHSAWETDEGRPMSLSSITPIEGAL